MLTREQHEEFDERGITVVQGFLSGDQVQSLKHAIDSVQGDTPYNNSGRWSFRNCLPRCSCFLDLVVSEKLLAMMVQLLGFNIKLLGSQIVKMAEGSQGESLTIDWHRDGGALAAELPHPLPKAFVKVGFCISGSAQPEGGELLVVPGSKRLKGDPVVDAGTDWPKRFTRVLVSPGDAVIFDWRTWHAVSRNSSDAVRRVLYLTFGFRWLSPMDYQVMPMELLRKSPLHWQLLGGSNELGSYLPSDAEVPLRPFFLDPLQQGKKRQEEVSSLVEIENLRERKDWQRRQRLIERQRSGNMMLARAIRDKTT